MGFYFYVPCVRTTIGPGESARFYSGDLNSIYYQKAITFFDTGAGSGACDEETSFPGLRLMAPRRAPLRAFVKGYRGIKLSRFNKRGLNAIARPKRENFYGSGDSWALNMFWLLKISYL